MTLSEVRPLVETGLTDADLRAVIDREEGWLAGRIGALTGVRTDTFRPGLTDTPIYIPRRADSVVVTDNGQAVAPADLRFVPASGMVRRITGVWAGPVTVTYTPSDGDAVRRAVIELVRGTLAETGSDAETIGDYSYDRGDATARLGRGDLARSVLLRRPAYAARLRSSLEPA
ncbi:MAG TPA: hypothetical protein VLM76_04540 [Patescibacteria group bacterium]|nr:hypothetical protein [Patescibacteria group bacterium]